MTSRPTTRLMKFPEALPGSYDRRIERRLSAMRGQFHDAEAYESGVSGGDPVLYEVYEFGRPEVAGDLLSGVSVLHAGRVGDEYFMTKGHFHRVIETAEVYYCLRGRGVMVMETPEGESSVLDLVPGGILHVPPRWAHRTVNTSANEDLVTLFVYPANAGHDYASIEERGFRKLVVERDGVPGIVDNPRWTGKPPLEG